MVAQPCIAAVTGRMASHVVRSVYGLCSRTRGLLPSSLFSFGRHNFIPSGVKPLSLTISTTSCRPAEVRDSRSLDIYMNTRKKKSVMVRFPLNLEYWYLLILHSGYGIHPFPIQKYFYFKKMKCRDNSWMGKIPNLGKDSLIAIVAKFCKCSPTKVQWCN